MTRSYRYLHLDVFTDRVFGGNQLAVFLDGRGLSAETMQAIAKEMRHCPVMKLDSSLARKTTKFAMSIGSPIRPIGMVFMTC